MFFFFNDTATTEIYTLSLRDALPISRVHVQTELDVELPRVHAEGHRGQHDHARPPLPGEPRRLGRDPIALDRVRPVRERSEEHTSELQSRQYLVCRLLLEKKKRITTP